MSPPSELVAGRRASPVQNLPQQPPSNPCMHGEADAQSGGRFEWTLNDDDDDLR